MLKNVWSFVKNHKRGFIIGAGLTLLTTVAAVAMGGSKDEPKLIDEPEYEVSDANEEVAEDMVEGTEIE